MEGLSPAYIAIVAKWAAAHYRQPPGKTEFA